MNSIAFPSTYIYLVQFYLLFSTIFGRAFYKAQFLGIHFSEFLALIAGIAFIYSYLSTKKKLFFPPELLLFFLLWIIVLVISLLSASAPIDIILRQSFQGINVILFFIFVNTLKNASFSKNAKRIFAISSLFLVMSELFFFNFSNLDSLYIYVILAFLISGRKYANFSIISLLVLPVILDHAATLLATIFFIVFYFYFFLRKYLILLSLFSVPAFLLLIPIIPDLYAEIFDYNATWRFLYWADVSKLLLQDWAILTGYGYGIQYINPDLDNFDRLIQQISWFSNSYEQSFLVPPHNSLLNLIYHLGIFGCIFFLILYFRVLKLVVDSKNLSSIVVLASITPLIVTHNFLELPQLSIGFITIFALVACKSLEKKNEDIAYS